MNGADPRIQLLILAMLLYPATNEASAVSPALRRLRDLSSEELVLLVRAGYPKVTVSLDDRSIDLGLRMIRERREHEERLDYFISHGATTALLRQLFRLPVSEIKARRVKLLGRHKQRRPQLPKPRERDAIHRAWWGIYGIRANQPPTAEQYLRLHEQFPQFTFATLFAVINEFEENA